MKKQSEILAKLTPEDTRLWRMNASRGDAMKLKPEAYSREEIEQNQFERMRLGGELLERYGINEAYNVSIQTWTGTIEWEDG